MSNIYTSRILICVFAICPAALVSALVSAQATVPPQDRASLGVNIVNSGEGRGVTVTRVQPNTPAEQMGLRTGDLITSLNGRPVRSSDEFIATIRNMRPGDEVELRLSRDETGELTIRGPLDAHRVSGPRSEQSSADEFGAYQEVIDRNRPPIDERKSDNRDLGPQLDTFGRDAQPSADRADSDSSQTNLEDRMDSKDAAPGDLNARMARIEEHLDRITEELAALRSQVGTGRLSDREPLDLRPRSPAQPRPNEPIPNSRVIRQIDRWNVSENRYQQADWIGARERAAQEAARRQADALGAQLQQQERARTRNTQPPATTQPPGDQPPTR